MVKILPRQYFDFGRLRLISISAQMGAGYLAREFSGSAS